MEALARIIISINMMISIINIIMMIMYRGGRILLTEIIVASNCSTENCLPNVNQIISSDNSN